MAVNIVQYDAKLRTLLEEFLSPNYQIKNDVYLNSLLSHLSGKDDKELGESLTNLPIFPKYVLRAVTFWEKSSTPPITCIGSFTLQLTALLSTDETRFLLFKSNRVYEKVYSIFKLDGEVVEPTIKLGFIKLLSAFLSHHAGLEYLALTDYWKDALKYCLSNQTIYIIREGQNFIYNTLEKSLDNVAFCDAIIKRILSVLTECHVDQNSTYPEVKEEYLQKKLNPTIHLLTSILETYLKSTQYKNRDYRLPLVLIKDNNLHQVIWDIVRVVHNKDLLHDLDKILIACTLIELVYSSKNENLFKDEMCAAGRNVLRIINDHLCKEKLDNALKLCYYFQYIWQFMKDKAERSDKNPHMTLENQMIVLQILPILTVSVKHCSVTAMALDTDDIRDHFITKLFKIMCEKTVRMAYSWRKTFCDQDDVFKTAQVGMIYLMKSTKYYDRKAIIIIFQSIMYGIKDIANAVKVSVVAQSIFTTQSTYLMTLIDAVSHLIKEYNITWRDCIETICVMTAATDLLSCPIWPTRLTVSMLRLLNISITKFMAPNLALLVDQSSNSIDALGPLLHTKLLDRQWEVRDSALEVVHSICSISSQTKFLSFQKVILESEFIQLVFTMSRNDSESFVQASAIRCLHEMIELNEFWNIIDDKLDFLLAAMTAVRTIPEPNVRCEMATLICKMYTLRQIEEKFMRNIYKCMCNAVIVELNWEVKIAALNFWEKVICYHLQNQGMIDGSFPNVTFSKEHRKIVTLTESEIQTRLNKVLVQLSECMCLTVLCYAIEDDCDLEVTKRAVSITSKLANLLKAHNLNSVSNLAVPTSPQPSLSSSGYSSAPITPNADILDEAIIAGPLRLMDEMFHPTMDDREDMDEIRISKMKLVTPEEFLNFIPKDLTSIIEEKQKWMNGIDDLGSLLDDMLKTYEEDVNTMDCY